MPPPSSTATRDVRVDVSGKPEITSSPADLELQFGATAVFHCSADGDPDPEIIWLHNKYSRNPL